MPPKRRRDGRDGVEDMSPVPRTPKKQRTAGAATPRSSRSRGTAAALVAGSSEDEDELAASTPLQPQRKSMRTLTPSFKLASAAKTTPAARKNAGVDGTPTRSASIRRRARSVELEDPDAEGALTAQLILDVAAAEESEANENDNSDVQDGEATTNGVSLEGGFEAYFEQASRQIKTSNNTLSKMPLLSQADYLNAIRDYIPPYADATRDLYNSHVSCFPEWSVELDKNYALCLYGFGSKRSLIMDFVQREAEDYGDPYVVINGYHPSIDIRQICQSITMGLGSSGADVSAVHLALEHMSYDRLVLAFHNIDGQNLRSEKCQEQICRIAEHPRVRLICSIDHINATLLFPTSRLSRLSLLYHDATSFQPYTLETELLADTLSTSKKAQLQGDRGIQWILQTLSKNAQLIFKILLTTQLAEQGAGVESTRLFELASREFAVSNQTSYHAILGEFLDHEVIVIEKESGIGEVLKIPYSQEELMKLLSDINEAGTE